MDLSWRGPDLQPVREAVSYRGLFTAGWFGMREKHYFWLKIYDRLRASEQAACPLSRAAGLGAVWLPLLKALGAKIWIESV